MIHPVCIRRAFPPGAAVWFCLAVGLVVAGITRVSAQAPVPPTWRVDASLYPKAYGVIADDRLMHPVDVSNWPLQIDSSRQLFVDDELVASLAGVTRRINSPRKHPRNPLVVPDRPWEGDDCFFQTVLRDERSGRFRMWYSGRPKHLLESGKRADWPTCYAESADGIHWDKPVLRLHAIGGSRENNVVIPDGSVFGLMHRPDEPDPRLRFRALALRFQNEPGEGYFLYASEDGIHWTMERERAVIPSLHGYRLPANGIGDTSSFRWDPRLKKYIGDVKFVLPPKMRVRAIMESDDLIHWTRPRMTIYPDALDEPKAQIYGHHGFIYESMWIGMLRVMHDDLIADSYKQTTIELTASRDGRNWSRVADRAQFIPLGRPDEWDPHYHDAFTSPITVGDELWIYYRSQPLWKDMHDKISRIGLAILRRDGFVSLEAQDQDGFVVTRPLTFAGRTLFVNADVAESGSLTAEVQDQTGKPLTAYAFDRSIPVTGDRTKTPVRWVGGENIERDSSESLRLSFRLRKAKLYSFWIE